MPTIQQLVRKGRKKLTSKSKSRALDACPQRRGVCTRVYTTTPKKPNSAMRKCCKVQLTKNGRQVSAFIPGNLAQKFIDEHDEVMIERIGGKQGRAKGDIRGIRFQVIQVNDQPLARLASGKIEKGRR